MIYLTPLGSDNFTRPNESPLASPWAIDVANDPGIQIVSDLCEATETNAICGQFYDYADTPDDQFASFTLASLPIDNGVDSRLMVRWTDNGLSIGTPASLDAYTLIVEQFGGGDGGWFLYDGVSGFIGFGSISTFTAGDTFTLAALGTTLYVFQNSTQIGSVSNASYTSGSTGLALYSEFEITDNQLSGFAMGSASTNPPKPPRPPIHAYFGTTRFHPRIHSGRIFSTGDKNQ